MDVYTFTVYNLDLRRFVLYITESTNPYSIVISFCKDEYRTITAHTCSREITFPHNMLQYGNDDDNFTAFAAAMEAVMEGKTFNTV